MKRILCILALPIISTAVFANERCNIPGKTMHWIAEYCMHLSGTDDFFSGDVEVCFEKNNGYEANNTCEDKIYYKRKICELIIEDNELDDSIDKCIKNSEFIPNTVKNDGI